MSNVDIYWAFHTPAPSPTFNSSKWKQKWQWWETFTIMSPILQKLPDELPYVTFPRKLHSPDTSFIPDLWGQTSFSIFQEYSRKIKSWFASSQRRVSISSKQDVKKELFPPACLSTMWIFSCTPCVCSHWIIQRRGRYSMTSGSLSSGETALARGRAKVLIIHGIWVAVVTYLLIEQRLSQVPVSTAKPESQMWGWIAETWVTVGQI